MNEPTRHRPTQVRHGVVGSLVAMSFLLYLDRFCVGIAEPFIKQDLNLSTFQVGIFFSVFFLTYALGQVPAGWLSDRFGARGMLTLYILTWSFFTAMMGFCYGFASLLLMRAAYGAGQAGAYPTSASVVSKWVPFSNRGFASSLVAFGGRLGVAIAPVLTAVFIVLFVSPQTPSLLDGESLRDGPGFCLRLSPPDKKDLPRALQYVRSQLPDDVQATVDQIAESYRPIGERKKKIQARIKILQRQWRLVAAHRTGKEIDELDFELDNSDLNQIIAALNALIENEQFFQADEFNTLKNIDRSALRMMARVQRQETLSAADSTRFHRLLLEGCFPEELAKVYMSGWRPVMILYGASGVTVALLFFFVVRNQPAEHPRCNPAEVELIERGRPPHTPSPHGSVGRVPWSQLLRSYSLWLSCLSQVGTNIGWVFLVTWFPRYLLEAHQVPILERGLMASIPMFAGWLGMLGGGRLTDALVPRVGLKWGRRIPMAITRFSGMLAFIACLWLNDPWAITAALSLVAISTDLGTASVWAFCQDVGGKYVGSVLGWGNMWGNLGATVSPILLAWVFESWGWHEMFLVCAASFLASGLFALGVDATKPVVTEDV
ncbi:MAG: MFS transporter [Pirellulaceae bacterium]|nr:MFS transporter [Pirellulaceae bacterium]